MGPERILSTSGFLRGHAAEVAAVQRFLDATVIVAIHVAATWAYASGLREPAALGWTDQQTTATAIGVAGFLVTAGALGVYRTWRGLSTWAELRTTVAAWLCALPLVLLFLFATKSGDAYSRVITFTWFGATPIGLGVLRLAARGALRMLRARGYNLRTIAIAGSTPISESLFNAIGSDPSLGLKVRGVYDDRGRRRHPIPGLEDAFAGDFDALVEDARNGDVDIVYITLPLRAEERMASLISRLSDTTATVYLVPDLNAFALLHARWSSVGRLPVISVFDSPFSGLGGWAKRMEDIVLGTAILALIAIPMLIIAVLIKLDSRGPVFFQQKRYGLNGRPISVLKFRTMTVMEDGADVKQATKGDQRITKLGAFLRRNSLDELPQFLNVLMGTMSIVGPRPHAVAHNELYRARIQGYMLRHKVKPGITGWAQVNGWRGETDTDDKMEKRIEHDLHYIHHWRLTWDLRIIWMTVFSRSSRENAF